MQGSALRRIQTNLGFLNKFSRNFCQNNIPKSPVTEKKTKKAPYDGVLFQKHNHVMEIILNQPQKLNSVDIKMIKTLLRRVRQWMPENMSSSSSDEDKSERERGRKSESEEDVPRVILMSGAGGKSFCAGGDVAALCRNKKQDNEKSDKELKDFFRYEYLLDYSLSRMKPIQIAVWNGICMGGGVGLSINAPIRIATDNTLFAMPETAIGLFPDVGSTYFLPRIFNNDPTVGLYMGLTGDRLKGIDVTKCGLATHFVAQDKLEKLRNVLLEKVNEDTELEHLQGIVNEFADLEYNSEHFDFPKYEEIKRTFVIDSLDELFGRLQNLADNGSQEEVAWASNALNYMNKASPISLVVTFEQIKRGIKIKSLEEAFNLEAQLIAAFAEESDLFEGIRARLIEKDNKPNWIYKSYKEINQTELIRRYFDRSEEINVDPDDVVTEEKKLENEETSEEKKAEGEETKDNK